MSTLAPFLRPAGFVRPHVGALVREASLVAEGVRGLARAGAERHDRRGRPAELRGGVRGAPVLLVPGFMAGDGSLGLLARSLRHEGFRTYRARIRANVGCTMDASLQLEARLEEIVERRGEQAWIVGHSLGGMLARGLAVRRPDLVAGIVTLGSPVLAPGAHHVSLSAGVEALVRLSRLGLPGMMAEACVGGDCARSSFEEAQLPLPAGVVFAAVFSKRDGIVDWRACVDPLAHAIEVTASHLGMAVDPRVRDRVVAVLQGATASEA